jgi:hypothetical protein
VLAMEHGKSAGRYHCYLRGMVSLQEAPVLATEHGKSAGDTSVSCGAH